MADGWGKGGLNAFRLVNKRCKQVAESCTTKLSSWQTNGPEALPDPILKRCRRIAWIDCCSHRLRSLEGCPNGLKTLYLGRVPHLSDLSQLLSCSMMEFIYIGDSSIADISVVASMPLLEEFYCQKNRGRPSIKDLSPLSSCPRLNRLAISGNKELTDLSPLLACSALEYLDINHCPLISSLTLLSTLKNLRQIDVDGRGLDPHSYGWRCEFT